MHISEVQVNVKYPVGNPFQSQNFLINRVLKFIKRFVKVIKVIILPSSDLN
jgi:hypothetical protein